MMHIYLEVSPIKLDGTHLTIVLGCIAKKGNKISNFKETIDKLIK